MKALKSHRTRPAFGNASSPFRLNSIEGEFSAVMENVAGGLLHHCDRPEIEVRILAFLSHAMGPTTGGIARQMGISREAAEIHLRALSSDNRIWGQPIHSTDCEWHIAQGGRHFLKQYGSLAQAA